MSSANYAPSTELFKLLVHPSTKESNPPDDTVAAIGRGKPRRKAGGGGGVEGEGEEEDEIESAEVIMNDRDDDGDDDGGGGGSGGGGGKVVGVVEWIPPLPVVYGTNTHTPSQYCRYCYNTPSQYDHTLLYYSPLSTLYKHHINTLSPPSLIYRLCSRARAM